MAIVTTDNAHYRQIGETIRTWAQTDETYRPEDMWRGVESVYWKGHADGQEAGGGGSYEEGVEVGKQLVNKYWKDLTRNKKHFHYFFQCSDQYFLTETPEIITENGTHFNYMYAENKALRVIGGVLNLTNAEYTTSMFYGLDALEEVRFVPGSIRITNGFGQSPLLSDASIQSIIDGLADLTGKTTQTFTFHADVGAKLTEEQKAAITAKNWTLAY